MCGGKTSEDTGKEKETGIGVGLYGGFGIG